MSFTSLFLAVVPFTLWQEPAPDVAPKPERGVQIHKESAYAGYTLICPLMDKRTFLLDMDGEVVHMWEHELPPGNSVYLMPNGNLFRAARPQNNPTFKGGGEGGILQEWSWDGDLLWSMDWNDEEKLMHHDFSIMPNGNLLFIEWNEIDREIALAHGKDPELLGEGGLWPDSIVEIERILPKGGEEVWRWNTWDHIVQDRIEGGPAYGEVWEDPGRVDVNGEGEKENLTEEERERLIALGYLSPDQDGRPQVRGSSDWMHSNGVDYDPVRDLIVISVRRFNEFWVIDHSTTTEEAATAQGGNFGRGGRLLYRYGHPQAYGRGGLEHRQLFFQHDSQFIDPGLPGEGNILVYNNGQGRPGEPWSSVDEIDFSGFSAGGEVALDANGHMLPNEPVWRYGSADNTEFYSSFISGAQRLANGNTLICEGADGRVFEVTREGEIVWEYLSPWGDSDLINPPGQGKPALKTDAQKAGGADRPRARDRRPPRGGGLSPGRGGDPPRDRPDDPPRGDGDRDSDQRPRRSGIPPWSLFRATRIAGDFPAFRGKNLQPLTDQPKVKVLRAD
ncbi:MAG: aryl-sulfate sulfotransferase [Planctomycetes bacterium]|nr:aryl-sulfate sulfotransferase [Planctomycetota bacterium]